MSDIVDEMGGYLGDGSEFELPPQVKDKLEYHSNPAPQPDLDEEMAEVLSKNFYWKLLDGEKITHLDQKQALSQLKQLSLKDVLEMIKTANNLGEYEDWGTYGEGFEACQKYLEQSARKRYQS